MAVNRSVLRTKKLIRQAFIELLAEKQTVEKITIMELTERANIVRSTFYSHYEDIYAVAKEIQSEICQALGDAISTYASSKENDLSVPMTSLIEFFSEREVEYRRLFNSGYNENHFISQLKSTISTELFEKLPLSQSEVFNNDLKLEARFYAEMFVDMVCGYLRGVVNMNLYQIRDFLLVIIKRLA